MGKAAGVQLTWADGSMLGQSRAVPSREIAHRRHHPECGCITAGNGGIDQVPLGMRVEGRAFKRCLEWDGSALGS